MAKVGEETTSGSPMPFASPRVKWSFPRRDRRNRRSHLRRAAVSPAVPQRQWSPPAMPSFLYFQHACSISLEQSGNVAVVVAVDLQSRRCLRQTRHGHDVAGENNHKASAVGQCHVTDRDGEVFRLAQLRSIIRQGVLCLCHAYRQIAAAQSIDLCQRFAGAVKVTPSAR